MSHLTSGLRAALDLREYYTCVTKIKTKDGQEQPVGGAFLPMAVARDDRTRAERVVYVVVDGPDEGAWRICSLADFHLRFRRLALPDAPPQRVSDR